MFRLSARTISAPVSRMAIARPFSLSTSLRSSAEQPMSDVQPKGVSSNPGMGSGPEQHKQSGEVPGETSSHPHKASTMGDKDGQLKSETRETVKGPLADAESPNQKGETGSHVPGGASSLPN